MGDEQPKMVQIHDIIPELILRNGRAPQRSGERLDADLHAAREGLDKLNKLCLTSPIGDCQVVAQRFIALIQHIVAELDSIDTGHPPPADYFDLVSARVELISNGMAFFMLKLELEKMDPEIINESDCVELNHRMNESIMNIQILLTQSFKIYC